MVVVESFHRTRPGRAGLCLLAGTGRQRRTSATVVRRLDSRPRNGAKRILSRVLPNVYRAFEFPTESAAYDRLALSVTGDTLTEVYLEHRRAVTMEERGGARARVEAVEVVEVDSVEPDGSGRVSWPGPSGRWVAR